MPDLAVIANRILVNRANQCQQPFELAIGIYCDKYAEWAASWHRKSYIQIAELLCIAASNGHAFGCAFAVDLLL